MSDVCVSIRKSDWLKICELVFRDDIPEYLAIEEIAKIILTYPKEVRT